MNPDERREMQEREAIIKFFGSTYQHGQKLDQSKIEHKADEVPISLNVQKNLERFMSSTKRRPLPPPAPLPPVDPRLELITEPGPPPTEPRENPISSPPPMAPNNDLDQLLFDFGGAEGLKSLHDKCDRIIKDQKKILDILSKNFK